MTLAAPFPWFGGKRRAAALVWSRFGNVPNYVEPFAGSLAVLLGRPGGPGKVETANDLDAFVANFWRAVQTAPAEVAEWADWPVNEADLHPRHAWLVAQREGLRERLLADPEYSDAKIAGWWVWGISAWIGNGWCSKDERLHQSLPKVGVPGNGIHAPTVRNQRPALSAIGRGVHAAGKKPRTHRGTGLHRSGLPSDIFDRLRDRLRGVRVCCGDWMRVLGRSTLGLDTSHGMTPTGVLLDPPYAHDLREKRLYAEDHADRGGGALLTSERRAA